MPVEATGNRQDACAAARACTTPSETPLRVSLRLKAKKAHKVEATLCLQNVNACQTLKWVRIEHSLGKRVELCDEQRLRDNPLIVPCEPLITESPECSNVLNYFVKSVPPLGCVCISYKLRPLCHVAQHCQRESVPFQTRARALGYEFCSKCTEVCVLSNCISGKLLCPELG